MAYSTKKIMRQPCRISHLSGRVENNQTSTRAVGKGGAQLRPRFGEVMMMMTMMMKIMKV